MQDVEDSIDAVKQNIGDQLDDLTDRYTPQQVKEMKRKAERYIDRKAEEITDEIASFTEELATNP